MSGKLPAGWEEKKLGEVCAFEKKPNKGKYLQYVGLEHIESNTGIYLGSQKSVEVKSSTFQFDNSHVLYGRLRPYLNKVLKPEFCGHCSTEIFPIKPHNNLDRSFLFHWLMSDMIVEKINATCTGARMPRADMNKILGIVFPLPPLSEQKRIVAILDEAFAVIAKAKENAEKNLADARELFESYLEGVFKRGARGGAEWEEKKLDEISENLDSKRVPITKNVRSVGNIPYYGASGIVDYVDDYLFDENLLCVSEDGANLLARTYPIAFSISGKTWVNNHAHVLRFKHFESQKYVEYYLNIIRIEAYVSGMAQPKLNQAMLNQIPIPFPPLPEQRRIVERLDALSAETKRLESIYRRKIADLDELKKAILERAFKGEL